MQQYSKADGIPIADPERLAEADQKTGEKPKYWERNPDFVITVIVMAVSAVLYTAVMNFRSFSYADLAAFIILMTGYLLQASKVSRETFLKAMDNFNRRHAKVPAARNELE